MKILYTGKLDDLSKDQKKNLEKHYGKLGKLVDKRGEREAHVMLTKQRHTQKAEVTMNYYGAQVVGTATHKDQFLALLAAVDKLEIQLLKNHEKRNDAKRHGETITGRNGSTVSVKPALAKAAKAVKESPAGKPSVLMAKVQKSAKPLTVEEAVLNFKPRSQYFAFEDAETQMMCVLARLKDGSVELIETR
jgi:putative sigma-54 modulation protein